MPGTSHIIRKVLQSETWSLGGGGQRWFKRSTRKKRPVTGDNNKNNIIIIPRVGSGLDTRGEGRFPYDSGHLPL
jgi:hypothetical protein